MNKMMKIALTKPVRDEKGQAMILVLILLVLGSLIIAPLLGFMSTGLLAGQMLEEKMGEIYTADAGVEDGLWNLIYGGLLVDVGTPATLAPFTMNDVTVNVTIENVGEETYKITSVAGDSTIEAHVTGITRVYTGGLDGDDLGPGETIYDDVFVDGDIDLVSAAGIQGNVVATGDITLNSGAYIAETVCSGGNLRLNNAGTVVTGDVYVVGDVWLASDTQINGDIHAGGMVTLNARAKVGDVTDSFNIHAVGDVTVGGSNAWVSGAVHSDGNVEVWGGGLNKSIINGDVYLADGSGSLSGSGQWLGECPHTGEIEGYIEPILECPLSMGGPDILAWRID